MASRKSLLSRSDLVAGATTAVLLVPQAMGYAALAGLPPIAGLYAATVPLVLYALLGRSRQLAIGPVALDSMLVAASVGPLAAGDASRAWGLATLLALLVGALHLFMAAVGGARLTRWLTRPVLTGFTAAAAVLIAVSQLGPLMGVHVPRSPELIPLLRSLALALPQLSLPTLGIGLAGVTLLIVLKRRWPRFPRALLLVALSSVVVFAFGLASSGVAVVGSIPAGLPTPQLPSLSLADVLALAPSALVLWLVGFSEATSIGAHFARAHDYALAPRRELVALGLANLGAGLFHGYPVTGGFARSAVHDAAGARTTRAGLVTAALVALTLSWLTPLLRDLPMAALGAIILTALSGLVDLEEMRRLRARDRAGLGLMVLTCAATLGLGIVWGLVLGAGVAGLMRLLRRSAPKDPQTSRRGDCSASRP